MCLHVIHVVHVFTHTHCFVGMTRKLTVMSLSIHRTNNCLMGNSKHISYLILHTFCDQGTSVGEMWAEQAQKVGCEFAWLHVRRNGPREGQNAAAT